MQNAASSFVADASATNTDDMDGANDGALHLQRLPRGFHPRGTTRYLVEISSKVFCLS
jgi:hypothetical protein